MPRVPALSVDSGRARASRPWQLVVLPLAALLAVLPLLLHGPSCGHDQGFHVLSWFDAAYQLRHGHWPRWAISPAWNAGEPRFIFYPPLSWLLGAAITMHVPPDAAPLVYIWLVLSAAGLAMHRLAREFASPAAALPAAALYLANPYMLFNAFERSALAELLAAVWMPLLLLAVLRARPSARGLAVPLALLWLTNAPAAVMGSYLLALLAALRVTLLFFSKQDDRPPERTRSQPTTLRLALTYLSGTVLGLALPAFYLVPAAVERGLVQVDMAIIPNLRFQDNFLFDNTADAGHNGVNHNISLLAVTLLAITALAVAALLLLSNRQRRRVPPVSMPTPGLARIAVAVLTLLIAFLLFPVSTPVWQHLPEFAFLQFPWRLLTVLAVVLALTLALLIDRLTAEAATPASPSVTAPGHGSDPAGAPSTHTTWRMDGPAAALSLLLSLGLGLLLYAHTAQACENHDSPASIASLLRDHHGVAPTDEYTPTHADNDVLRTGNPGYWLAAKPTDPAPKTVPTPAELNPSLDNDDTPVPFDQTVSTPAPHHLQLHTDRPGYLILNLRDYPNWDVTEAHPSAMELHHPAHIARDDGLIAIRLDHADDCTLDIAWHRTWDQTLGLILSALALFYLTLTSLLHRPKTHPS
jgi:hypothetical protein